MSMRTVMVQVTFKLPVEVSDSLSDEQVEFILEDNNCMWTGPTGSALDNAIALHALRGTCAGCALGSSVEVLWDEPVRDVIESTRRCKSRAGEDC